MSHLRTVLSLMMLLALLVALVPSSAHGQPAAPIAIDPVEFTPTEATPAAIYEAVPEESGPTLESTHTSDTIFAVVNNGATEIALRLCSPGPHFQIRSESLGKWMTEIFYRTQIINGCSPSPTSWWRMVIGITPGTGERFRIYSTAYEKPLGAADYTQRARRYLCTVPAMGQLSCTREVVTAPQVVIDSPVAGQAVANTTAVCGWAVDKASGSGPGVLDVTIRVNGLLAGTASYGGARTDVGAYLGESRFNPSGYCLSLNTRSFANGPATLSVTSRSALTGVGYTVSRAITIANTATVDITPPDGRISAPANLASVGPSSLAFSASAWDNAGGSGVAQVDFSVFYNNGWNAIGSDSTAPYSLGWTIPLGLGSQQIRFAITIVDRAGNRRSNAGGYVTVNYNAAPGVVAQGFDSCAAPSDAAMSRWRQSSPYKVIGIYIGGSARGCAQANLSAAWARAQAARGWRFIPIWVGPQAPCTGFRSRLSYDPTLAYSQGVAEARSALAAARGLALTNVQGKGTVIYYDMEAYSTANAACHTAVKSFFNGWVGALHDLGNLAAIYGSSCGSGAASWATLTNVPDSVWLAAWNRTSYDPAVSVYGVSCVSDGLWSSQQRIRQYAGGHQETWGGVTINIDSNRVFGSVVLPDIGAVKLSTMLAAEEPAPTLVVDGPAITSLQLAAPNLGWVLMDGRLRLSEDGGDTWRALDIPEAEEILAARFDTTGTGLVLATISEHEALAVKVFSTHDRGATWQASELYRWLPETGDAPPFAGAISLTDGASGWALVQIASSPSFSIARLFHTADGASWDERVAPIAGDLTFTSVTHGTITGGVDTTVTYQTEDGGLSWQPATSLASAGPTGPDGATVVSYATANDGWALVPSGACGADDLICRQHSEVLATHDGGSSWASIAVSSTTEYRIMLPLVIR